MYHNRHIAALLQTGSGNARKLSLKFLGSDESVGLQDGRAREFSKADLFKIFLGTELMRCGFNLNTAAGTIDMFWNELGKFNLMPGQSSPHVAELRIYPIGRRDDPELGGPEGIPILRFIIRRKPQRGINALSNADRPLAYTDSPVVDESYQDDPKALYLGPDKMRRSVFVCLNISELLTEFEFALRKIELEDF